MTFLVLLLVEFSINSPITTRVCGKNKTKKVKYAAYFINEIMLHEQFVLVPIKMSETLYSGFNRMGKYQV